MGKRIFVKEIDSCKEGYCYGRVVSITDNILYLCDESGVSSFNMYGAKEQNVSIGDLIRIEFENKKITSLEILNKIKKNPVSDSNSAFYKLNKDDGRLRKILINRQKFFRALHNFFYDRDFVELHTPTLVESPGIEEYIEPFVTSYFDYSNKKQKFYLPTSPEFSLKEGLTAGLERIYEIKKVFRNYGENSSIHSPEFFMVEWYRAFDSYTTIMQDVEELLQYLGKEVYNKTKIHYKERIIDFRKVKRIRLKTLFFPYNIDLDDYTVNKKKFRKDVSKYLSGNIDNLKEDDLFFKFFLDKIEPTLGFDNPTIVYEYPVEMCNLSQKCKEDPLYAERFELYICGLEIANAFGELTDPVEQRQRFEKVIKNRHLTAKTKLSLPKRFLNSLEYGMPPSGGIALGIERLFMIFEALYDIKQTRLF